jgi:predicted NAD/FAD-dependent oxidoreductase
MNRGTTADIVIVGAGVAGLAAAERLQRHGVEVLVVDKGRRPGGRLATRARGVTSFDHGAQYFTARDPAFAAFVDSLRDRGIVAPWAGRLVTIDGGTVMSREDGETRWVGVPEMNALAAAMAADESVIRGARVTDLLRDDGRWRVQLDDGAIVVANAAVVTPPPEQTAALLGTAAPELAAAAAAVPMAPCWAAMATFEAPGGSRLRRCVRSLRTAVVGGAELQQTGATRDRVLGAPRLAGVVHRPSRGRSRQSSGCAAVGLPRPRPRDRERRRAVRSPGAPLALRSTSGTSGRALPRRS